MKGSIPPEAHDSQALLCLLTALPPQLLTAGWRGVFLGGGKHCRGAIAQLQSATLGTSASSTGRDLIKWTKGSVSNSKERAFQAGQSVQRR